MLLLPLPLLHVATSSFCPTGNMTKKVKLLPNTHTHKYTHILTSRKGSAFLFPFAIPLTLPVICKCDNASYSHTAFSVPVRLVSSFKTPPKNDKRDQNWTNSCCCCFSFFLLLLLLLFCCCFCWDMQIRKWVRGECAMSGALSALSSFNSLPLALDIFGPQPPRRVQSARVRFQLSEYPQSQCQCQSQSPFTFTLTSTSPFVSVLIASVHLLGKV